MATSPSDPATLVIDRPAVLGTSPLQAYAFFRVWESKDGDWQFLKDTPVQQYYSVCGLTNCGGQWYEGANFGHLTVNQAAEEIWPVDSPRSYLVWVLARAEGESDFHYVSPGQQVYCAATP